MPDLATILTGICAIAAMASLIIQHRRTPKLPEPPITPISTTILGVNLYGHIRDLPGHSCRRTSNRR